MEFNTSKYLQYQRKTVCGNITKYYYKLQFPLCWRKLNYHSKNIKRSLFYEMSTANSLSFRFLCRILAAFVSLFLPTTLSWQTSAYLDNRKTNRNYNLCLNVKSSERSPSYICRVFCILCPLRIVKIVPSNINHSTFKSC